MLYACMDNSHCSCGHELKVHGEVLELPENQILVVNRNIVGKRCKNTTPVIFAK